MEMRLKKLELLSFSLLMALLWPASAAPAPAPAPAESPFGVSGIDYRRPEHIERAKNLGAGQVVVELCAADWSQGAEGMDLKTLGVFLQTAADARLKVLIAFIPPAHTTDSAAGALVKTARAVAIRFQDMISGCIVGPLAGGEPDALKLAADFHQALRAAAPALRRAVELDSLDPAHLSAILKTAPAASPWSAVAVPFTGDRQRNLDQIANLVKACPVPLWALHVANPPFGSLPEVADAESMREAVYRPVQGLACGLQKVCWARLDDPETGAALYAYGGKKMKPSYRAYNVLIERLWPYHSVEVLGAGSDILAYRFMQEDKQITTVVWSRPGASGLSWNPRLAGAFDIGDVCGSLVNTPASQLLSIEPLYYIESPSQRYKRPTHHGRHLTPDERPWAYARCAFPALSAPASVLIGEGWDWTLPAGIEPLPDSGFFNFDEKPSRDIDVIGWHPKWKDWHIGPGRFDFSSLERKLQEARAQGFRVCLRLQSVNIKNVPEWLIQKYNPPQATIPGPLRLRVVAPWDERVRAEFEAFVREFGRRGFASDPALAFLSIHGISEATGEEFSMSAGTIRVMEEEAGLTPPAFRAWVLGRIGAWADAFGGQAHKLSWVGGQGGFAKPEYGAVAREAVDLCLRRGIGGRGGFVEMYNYKFNEPIFGQSVSPEGYLAVDEQRMASNPCLADENEEYLSVKRWRFGLLEEDLHRWRVSTLRTLQLRCKYVSTNPMSMDQDRQLTEYARRSLGRTAANTPDAWCLLREATVRGEGGRAVTLKNFERWLLQRDLPGGVTRPAARLDRTYAMTTDPPGAQHEFTARRTDHAAGQNHIYFDVDDRLMAAGGCLLKVTFRDEAKADWRVDYATADGALKSSPVVAGRADGAVNTATFWLPGCRFRNALPHGQDFRITTQGPGDVTVMFVRVLPNSGSTALF